MCFYFHIETQRLPDTAASTLLRYWNLTQIIPHRDVDVGGCFRRAWTSLNFDKQYLFVFETLVFATSGILSTHHQRVTPQRERKREISSYDPFKIKKLHFWQM